MPGLLFARKVKVPLLKVTAGCGAVGEARCWLTAVLSSVTVPPWPMATALVPRVPNMLMVSEPAVKLV